MGSFAFFLTHEEKGQPVEVDLASMIADAAQEAGSRCAEERIHLKTAFPSQNTVVKTDPEKIRSILRELIANAVEATSEGGTIEVSLAMLPKGFQIAVADTGCGITADQQEHLFTGFRLTSISRFKGGRRMGLGLALVRHFLDLLNGEIQVESAPGKGSRFTLTF